MSRLAALGIQTAQPVSSFISGQQARQQSDLQKMQMEQLPQQYANKNRLAELQIGSLESQQADRSRLRELMPSAMGGEQGAMNEIAGLDYSVFKNLSAEQKAQAAAENQKYSRLLAYVESQPPEARPQAYQQALGMAQEMGLSTEGAPPEYDPQFVGGSLAQFREVDEILGVGDANRFGKSLTEAIDPRTGERVFVQASGSGGAQIVDGISPVTPQVEAERARLIEEAKQDTPQGRAQTAAAEAKAAETEKKVARGRQIKQTALERVDELLADPESLSSIVGLLDGRLPATSERQQDALNRLEQLRNILTADNLGIMSGVLSETDLRVISDIAGGGLKRVGSEKSLIDELKRLKASLSKEIGVEPEGDTSIDDLVNQYAD